MERAWTLYRRSTNLQESSIQEQKEVVANFAKANNLQIIKEFILGADGGDFVSGKYIERDQTFIGMLKEAEQRKHGVQYLLIHDVSRFGRLDPDDKIYYERKLLKEGGIRVVYVTDGGLKRDTSFGDQIGNYVKHEQARAYSERLSQDTIRGLKNYTKQGYSGGGTPPFGYMRLAEDSKTGTTRILEKGQDKVDSEHIRWVVDEKNAEVVKQIFLMFSSGSGLKTIVNWLNSQRISSPRKGTWNKSSVWIVLKNSSYTGTRTYFKRCYHLPPDSPETTKLRPLNEWIVVENAHEKIVSKELFEKVQPRLNATTNIGRGKSYYSPYLLSGLGKCGRCGYNYQGAAKTHNGTKVKYYVCGGYAGKGKSVCPSYSVKSEEIESYIVNEIAERVKQTQVEVVRERLKEMIKSLISDEVKSGPDVLEKMIKNQRERENLIKAIKNGICDDNIREELDKLNVEYQELTKKQAEIRLKVIPEAGINQAVEEMVSYLNNFQQIFNKEGSIEEKKLFVRGYVHDFVVNPETGEIMVSFYKIPYKFAQIQEQIGELIGEKSSFKAIAGEGVEPTTRRL